MPNDHIADPTDRCSVRRATRADADAVAAAHVAGWRGGYRGIFPDEYLDSDAFADERRDMWRSWGWVEHLPTALDRAAELADEGGVGGGVVATGSITTIADVRLLLGVTTG